MKQIQPTPIICKTAGAAIALLELARRHCLSASYHPRGGETARRNFPISHTLWVTGTEANYRAFAAEMRTR